MSSDLAQLTAHNISVHFAGVKALDDVGLDLREGEILGLIGPNGAGKTTLLNVLSGFQLPTTGDVMLGERVITKLSAVRRSRVGIVRTFQAVRLFERLTALENIMIGALGAGRSETEAHRTASSLLDDAGLGGRADTPAGAFTHGEARILSVLRALALEPRQLLLDEPAAGLNEAESAQLADFMRTLPEQYGLSLLLVEHDMRVIMTVCDRIHVVDHGATLAVGDPKEIQSNPEVRAAYLG